MPEMDGYRPQLTEVRSDRAMSDLFIYLNTSLSGVASARPWSRRWGVIASSPNSSPACWWMWPQQRMRQIWAVESGTPNHEKPAMQGLLNREGTMGPAAGY